MRRPGIIDENLRFVDDKDVEDLRNILGIDKPETFRAQTVCVLNPTFGTASQLIGGADADLVIDDMIIDIKTVKELVLKREYFNQIIGYYALYRIGGIDGLPPRHKIKRLGIYFSRYSYLYTINVQDIIDKTTFQKFLTWFEEQASLEPIRDRTGGVGVIMDGKFLFLTKSEYKRVQRTRV